MPLCFLLTTFARSSTNNTIRTLQKYIITVNISTNIIFFSQLLIADTWHARLYLTILITHITITVTAFINGSTWVILVIFAYVPFLGHRITKTIISFDITIWAAAYLFASRLHVAARPAYYTTSASLTTVLSIQSNLTTTKAFLIVNNSRVAYFQGSVIALLILSNYVKIAIVTTVTRDARLVLATGATISYFYASNAWLSICYGTISTIALRYEIDSRINT